MNTTHKNITLVVSLCNHIAFYGIGILWNNGKDSIEPNPDLLSLIENYSKQKAIGAKPDSD